jgi:hypothetical protein
MDAVAANPRMRRFNARLPLTLASVTRAAKLLEGNKNLLKLHVSPNLPLLLFSVGPRVG